jgi:drug/metabolite transporter (DMT)-like permease
MIWQDINIKRTYQSMKLLLRKYTGEFLLTLSAFSYCFEWYLIRELYQQKLSPLDITLIRSFFTCIMIGIFFFIYNKKFFKFEKITFYELKYIFFLSCSMLACGICFNSAIQTTTVANTLVIFYSCIFWGTLYGFLFLNEKSSFKIIILICFAFIGICLALIKSGNTLSIQFGSGEIYALAGSLIFPIDAVLSRKIRYANTIQRLFLINFLGVIIVILAVLSFNNVSYFMRFLTWNVLYYAFILALTCGLIAKWLMYAGYNRTPVSIALVILLFEPITQMTTAYFVAGEKMTLINGFGILIVLMMVILISRQKTKASA